MLHRENEDLGRGRYGACVKNIKRPQYANIFHLQLEKPQQKTPLRPCQCR
jgi:hypothetical protein